ncbi:MAG: hypothetical protein HY550_05960 [Elusimicrobia bacterium]|nr:hypothetical protein [Elusimicrobiota bacterium]
MSERTRRIITGVITGTIVGISLEVLRGSGYLDGISVMVRSVVAGLAAIAIYSIVRALVRPGRPSGPSKV